MTTALVAPLIPAVVLLGLAIGKSLNRARSDKGQEHAAD
jgi:hypothetical protein